MQYENFTFGEAMQTLADKVGVELPKYEMNEAQRKEADKRARLLEINKEAAKYFYTLLRNPRGKRAYDYFKKRELTDETMQKFGLGYSDQYSDDLYRYLKSKGYGDDILKETGLITFDEVKKNEKIKAYMDNLGEVRVQYELATESIKTVVLSDNVVYSYDEVTHYDCSSEEGSLIPTAALTVPTNVNAVISNQRTTIQEQTEQINTLEEENALLIEQNEMQDVEIALNQEAINFMLFEAMGMSTLNENGGNPMAAYFANQIIKRKLNYTQVVNKYPQFKEDIDLILIAEGYGDLIVE
jgi:hypothetical protein